MSDTAAEEIKETMRICYDAYNKGDIDTCVSFYDGEARLMPPGFTPAIGSEAIAKGLNHSRNADGVIHLDHEPTEIQLLGDGLAFSHVNTQAKDGDGKTKGKVQSLGMWVKKDGQRKIYREMFNSRP